MGDGCSSSPENEWVQMQNANADKMANYVFASHRWIYKTWKIRVQRADTFSFSLAMIFSFQFFEFVNTFRMCGTLDLLFHPVYYIFKILVIHRYVWYVHLRYTAFGFRLKIIRSKQQRSAQRFLLFLSKILNCIESANLRESTYELTVDRSSLFCRKQYWIDLMLFSESKLTTFGIWELWNLELLIGKCIGRNCALHVQRITMYHNTLA
jgi:hypothetical protein